MQISLFCKQGEILIELSLPAVCALEYYVERPSFVALGESLRIVPGKASFSVIHYHSGVVTVGVVCVCEMRNLDCRPGFELAGGLTVDYGEVLLAHLIAAQH